VFQQLRGQWKAFCHGQQQLSEKQQVPQLPNRSAAERQVAKPQGLICLGAQQQPQQQQQQQAQVPAPQHPPQQLQQLPISDSAGASRGQPHPRAVPQSRQQQQGETSSPVKAAATLPARCSSAAHARRGRRAHRLSVRSRPRRVLAFRLRRRLVLQESTPPAATADPAERMRGGGSGGSTRDGCADQHSTCSHSSLDLSGAPGTSSAASDAADAPAGRCGSTSSCALSDCTRGCWAGSQLQAEASMPCGSSHCSSSCSEHSGRSCSGTAACLLEHWCSCQPTPSSTCQVGLTTGNMLHQDTTQALRRLCS
jgi:hypothetical protein